MKSKKIFFSFLLTFLSLVAKSQTIEFFYDLNFGLPFSYSLKTFHNELAEQVPLENFKTQDNFNYNYGFTFGVRILNKAYIFFNNKVSGAKSSLADYTGYIRITNELKGYTYGVRYDFYSMEHAKGIIKIGGKGFFTNSELILRTEAELFNKSDNEKIEFKSLDLGVGAGICYEYSLKNSIVKAYLDLDIVYGGKIVFKENNTDDGYLMNNNGNRVNTGWSGFNAGIGILIPLSK